MMMDNNKRVQEAGCSSVATIEEDALEKLVPYLEPILITFSHAFARYQVIFNILNFSAQKLADIV
jgi:transportin-1